MALIKTRTHDARTNACSPLQHDVVHHRRANPEAKRGRRSAASVVKYEVAVTHEQGYIEEGEGRRSVAPDISIPFREQGRQAAQIQRKLFGSDAECNFQLSFPIHGWALEVWSP